jgi:hypothetical protein
MKTKKQIRAEMRASVRQFQEASSMRPRNEFNEGIFQGWADALRWVLE